MIKLIIQEMDEALIDIRAVAAKHLAEKQACQRVMKEQDKLLQQWQEKAELAITKDREDLAKQALIEKQHIQNNIDNSQNELSQIELSLTSIQQDSEALNEKIHDAKARQKPCCYVVTAYSRLALKAKPQAIHLKLRWLSSNYMSKKLNRLKPKLPLTT